MKKIIFSISALVVLFAASCGSDGTNGGAIDISGKTKQEVFMMHAWDLSSWNDSSSQDNYDNIEACMKDDFYSFISTSQVEINRASLKCDDAEKPTEKFAWSMASADASQVTVFNYTWDISSLTGEQIVLRRKYLYNFGGTTEYIYSKVVLKKH
ncbi:MAG: hypothetical protein ACK4ZQ_00715 [Bacteroidota bacterium]